MGSVYDPLFMEALKATKLKQLVSNCLIIWENPKQKNKIYCFILHKLNSIYTFNCIHLDHVLSLP